MKKIKWTGWALLGAVLMNINLTSCNDDFDDSALRKEMEELTDRVAVLERLCQEMNTNVASLETLVKAVEDRDYVTAVAPIVKDSVEIGYTISFAKNSPITIYHGKDGVDGATPELGVKADDSGVYYWQLNGEWIVCDGKKLPVTGTNGTDGVTPQLEIREGNWFISYDKGASWTKLGKATGEPGNSLFKTVGYTATDMVFTLTDGTVLTVPLKQQPITSLTYYSGYADNLAIMDNEQVEKGQATLEFFLAPKEVVTGIQANWKETVAMTACYLPSSSTSETIDMPVKAVEADAANGILKVVVSGENLAPEFFQKKVEAQVMLTIQNQEQTITSKPIRIESSKVLDTMIKYTGTADVYPEIFNSEEWEGYTFSAHNTDATNHWLIFDQVVTKIPQKAFYYTDQSKLITSITLPQRVDTIGRRAFKGLGLLTKVMVGNQLKVIEEEAFRECNRLTEMPLTEGLEVIGNKAFYKTGLRKVVLPSTLRSLGEEAFSACEHIQSFEGKFASSDHCALLMEDTLLAFAAEAPADKWTVPGTVRYIAPHAFENNKNLKEITLPDGLELIDQSAFKSCTGLTSIVIPNSVTTIGSSAFSYCSGLKHVTLPNSLKTIEQMAFGVCTALTDVVIPNSVEIIESDAFNQCESLQQIDMPNSVTEIGDDTFYGCSALTAVHFSEKLESIGSSSFSACIKLTEITLPASLKSIDYGAFADCPNLKSITFKSVTPPRGYDWGFEPDAVIYVPAESVATYKEHMELGRYNIQPIPAQ